MANESQPPDSILAQTNLSGTLTDIDDDPDSPDANWMAAVDNRSDTVARVGFATPSGNPNVGAGLQEFRVLARAANAGGADVPWAMSLYEGGGDLGQIASGTLSGSSTGTVLSGGWNAGALSNADGSAVECRIAFTGQGGNPANRNTGEVGAVEWNVDYTVVSMGARTGSLDAVVQTQAMLGLAADGALMGRDLARVAGLDAALGALLDEAAALDAGLARASSAVAALDAVRKAAHTGEADIDGAVQLSLELASALHAALAAAAAIPATLDAVLSQGPASLAVGLDGTLERLIVAQLSLDGVLSRAATLGLGLEAALSRSDGKTATLNVALTAARTIEASLDAMLTGLTALLSAGLDVVLGRSPLVGAALDAWLNAGPAPSAQRSFDATAGERVRIVDGGRVVVVPANPRRH